MKNLLLTLFSICSFLSVTVAQAPELFINEFVASNESGITDASGEFVDWVEIYNAGNSAVDIGGMYVTDDLSAPTLWQIPTTDPATTTIQSGGFLILFFDKDTDEGVLHVDAKLGAGGEAIGLFASDGTAIDTYTFGPQLQDVSEGRTPDASANWDFFTSPTPGAANGAPTGPGIAAIPIASVAGGFYDNSVTISLTTETAGASIYYRMDGKIPDDNDNEYTGPITLNSTDVLRAVAYAPGQDASEIMTHTYIIDEDRSNFVVVAMTTDPDNLFDPVDGLFPNYEIELEKNAHIQFFETDGSIAFSQEIEIELHGNGSLSLDQKSLKMKAKASLGNAYFDHKIFPGEAPDKYRSFLMRQSGQDWNRTMFRDAIQQNLMDDVTDLNGILEEPDLDLQSYRPGILYINGEYWGIQNIRTQMNWKYLDAHYGLDEDEVDIVEDEDELKEGDLVEWEGFNDYLEATNFSDPANYVELREKADVDHFMDYMLHGIICDNNDWPGNNNRHWRERTEDGQWRWLSKDMDFGFGLRPINADWDSGDFTTNTLAICLAENSSEYYNRPPATLFLRRLMQNDEAKTNFINRAADLLNTVFDEDRIVNRIDAFEDIYTPQMQDHYDKWQSGWNGHTGKVEKLRIFANGRAPEVRTHFVDQFAEVDGFSDVAIDVNPQLGGTIDFNTLTLNDTHLPWEGIYFRGLEVPAFAKPNRGYLFENWSGAATGTDAATLVDINASSENLTANFQLGSIATDPIVINEINYNSPDDPDPADWVELHNPNDFAVDISAWYFEDESGEFFGFPANTIMEAGAYLLLVEDEATFASVYPNVSNVYGSFGAGDNGFGLSGKGELITLKNAAGILIDEVEFDDSAPWPEEPDGDGPTLQLITPALDNALPESWLGFEATPGEMNGNGLVVICSDPLGFDLAPGSTEMTVSWLLPEASTVCSLSDIVTLTQLSGPTNGSTLTEGTYTIEYGAIDECGNTSHCSFDITVTATELEADLNCPSEINLAAAPGATGAIATWSTPTGTTNCPLGNGLNITQAVGLPSGSIFPIGTSTITYTATDDCGSLTTCTFDVTVTSTPIESTLTCSDNIIVQADPGAPTTQVSWPTPTGSTNCPIANGLTITQTSGLPSGSLFPLGATLITYEATDDCGTQTTCVFEVVVISSPSTINMTCNDDISVVSQSGANEIVTWNAPTVLTNCSVNTLVTVTQTTGLSSGSSFPIGSYTISYEATDACGSVNTCSFEITVEDGTSLITMECPEDVNVVLPVGETSIPVSWSIPTVSTECGDGTANPNCGSTIPGFAFVGTLNEHQYYISLDKLTWPEAQANCLNYGGYLAVITDPIENEFIADNISDKVYIGMSDTNSEGNPEWVNGEPFTYSAIDPEPGTNTPGEDYGYLSPWSEEWKFFGDGVSKYYLMELDCAGGSSLELTQTGGPFNGGDLPVGTYSVTYQALDDCDGEAFCSFSVTVESNPQSLVVDCPNGITVTETIGTGGANVIWSDATAVSFNCAGPVEVVQTVGLASGSFFPVGNYVIGYEASDACGNVESCSFDLVVLPDAPSADYCETEGSSPWNERIINVTFGSINNDSGKEGYGDFTDQSTTLVAGESYPISITPKFSYTQYDEYFNVWIDYNGDNDFNDTGELVYNVFRPAGPSGTDAAPLTSVVEVPSNIASGTSRLRISMRRVDSADPCLFFDKGEVEDYGLILSQGFGGADNGFGRSAENEAFAKSFTVYPNPVKDLMTIDLGEVGESPQLLEIYNALGQRVFVRNVVEGAKEQLVVDVSEHGRGLYFVTVVDERSGERLTEQVLVD